MYKYAGMLMISAACASFGVISAAGMKRHIELLAALCGSLRFISAEIGTRLCPLPEPGRIQSWQSAARSFGSPQSARRGRA